MRSIRFAILMFLLLPITGWCQQKQSEIVDELRKLYLGSSVWTDKSINYQPTDRILELSGYRIGVNANTLVKSEIDKGREQKFNVSFYCQNGTSITRAQNPTDIKAFLGVPLKTKKACREFVKLFEALRQSN